MKHVSEHRECLIQEHRKQESLRGLTGSSSAFYSRTFDDCDTVKWFLSHTHLVL